MKVGSVRGEERREVKADEERAVVSAGSFYITSLYVMFATRCSTVAKRYHRNVCSPSSPGVLATLSQVRDKVAERRVVKSVYSYEVTHKLTVLKASDCRVGLQYATRRQSLSRSPD